VEIPIVVLGTSISRLDAFTTKHCIGGSFLNVFRELWFHVMGDCTMGIFVRDLENRDIETKSLEYFLAIWYFCHMCHMKINSRQTGKVTKVFLYESLPIYISV
jgi:hypothetical protein